MVRGALSKAPFTCVAGWRGDTTIPGHECMTGYGNEYDTYKGTRVWSPLRLSQENKSKIQWEKVTLLVNIPLLTPQSQSCPHVLFLPPFPALFQALAVPVHAKGGQERLLWLSMVIDGFWWLPTVFWYKEVAAVQLGWWQQEEMEVDLLINSLIVYAA